MKIIEIKSLDNGGHRNQTINGVIPLPKGWAIVPDNIETPNFPFGNIEAEEICGVMTVTKWEPSETPTVNEKSVTEFEQLRADVDYIAIMTGVEL